MERWISHRALRIGRAGFGVIGAMLLLAGLLVSPIPLATVEAASFPVMVTTAADVNDACATTGAAPCSLRDAIRYANTKTITLPAGTYNLTQTGACEDAAATGDLDINQNVILNGANPSTTIIDGMGSDRVFHCGLARERSPSPM